MMNEWSECPQGLIAKPSSHSPLWGWWAKPGGRSGHIQSCNPDTFNRAVQAPGPPTIRDALLATGAATDDSHLPSETVFGTRRSKDHHRNKTLRNKERQSFCLLMAITTGKPSSPFRVEFGKRLDDGAGVPNPSTSTTTRGAMTNHHFPSRAGRVRRTSYIRITGRRQRWSPS